MKSLESYLTGFNFSYTVFDQNAALNIYKPRDEFAHKGTFGHAIILAGSYGKIGAAVLAARACLCSGAGLLTVYLPSCGYQILQSSLPEAMVITDPNESRLTTVPESSDIYQSAGIGPGIGKAADTAAMLGNFLRIFNSALVVDADALNIISENPGMISLLRPGTIITPHAKEFERLFGKAGSDTDRMILAREMAVLHKIIIVLKGHFTGVFCPDGNVSFNTSGNAGMAKGGSGDVLTGIITALLAQSYEPAAAAKLGVFLHGHAGDLAAAKYSEESMLPGNLIEQIGNSFLQWSRGKD